MSMSHDEMIAVISAHRDGKPLQMRLYRETSENAWLDIPDPTFRFHYTDYRIKPIPPKPREWWFVKDLGEGNGCYGWTRHDVEQEGIPYLEQVHVREVLEESK